MRIAFTRCLSFLFYTALTCKTEYRNLFILLQVVLRLVWLIELNSIGGACELFSPIITMDKTPDILFHIQQCFYPHFSYSWSPDNIEALSLINRDPFYFYHENFLIFLCLTTFDFHSNSKKIHKKNKRCLSGECNGVCTKLQNQIFLFIHPLFREGCGSSSSRLSRHISWSTNTDCISLG